MKQVGSLGPAGPNVHASENTCISVNFMGRYHPIALCLLVTLLLSPSADANLIVGTIGFNVDGEINPGLGDLNEAFGLSGIFTNNTASGDWTAFSDGKPVAGSMQFGGYPSNGGAFSFSDPGFGSFSGTVQFDSGQVGDPQFLQRQVIVVGDFTPGSDLVAMGFTETVNGQLSVIIQNIGGGARSSSIVFGTTAVPEPASLVLAIFGLTTLGMRRWARA